MWDEPHHMSTVQPLHSTCGKAPLQLQFSISAGKVTIPIQYISQTTLAYFFVALFSSQAVSSQLYASALLARIGHLEALPRNVALYLQSHCENQP